MSLACPKCGSVECWRDEVDVGVGTVSGPWGCPDYGWSEDNLYDGGLQEKDGGHPGPVWRMWTPKKEKL